VIDIEKKPSVLFLCTGNSCRSQMAEGWARHLKSDQYTSYSAGTNPQGVNPLARKAMEEVGIDLAQHTSKHMDDLVDVDLDLVVTVCDAANEACPVLPGSVKHVHHSFDDPPALAKNCTTEEEALQHYRRVRDEIRAYILSKNLFAEESVRQRPGKFN
jgi:arsenate reductase